jgi:hypothetical protein
VVVVVRYPSSFHPPSSPLAVSTSGQSQLATCCTHLPKENGGNAVLTRIIGIELCLPPCGVGHAAHCTEVFMAGANTIPAPAPKVAREPARRQVPCPEFSDAKCRRFRARPSRAADLHFARERARACGWGGEYSEFLICKGGRARDRGFRLSAWEQRSAAVVRTALRGRKFVAVEGEISPPHVTSRLADSTSTSQ